MTGRRLTWLLATLLAIPVIALSLAAIVTGTNPGTRWLVDFARPRLPAQLQIGEVEGSLLRGITLEYVSWDDERSTVVVRSVSADLELLPLMDRRVRISKLVVGDADIRIRPPQTESGRGPSNIDLPVVIDVDGFESGPITISAGGPDRRIERVTASAVLNGNRLNLRELAVASDWLNVSVAGSLRVAGRFAADLGGDWSIVMAGERWAGHLEAEGNVGGYTIDHRLTEPYDLTSHGTLSLDGTSPRVDLRHEWLRIRRQINEREIESVNGTLLTVGTRDQLQLDLATVLSVAPLENAEVSLSGTTDFRSLSISSLEIRSALGDATVSGTIGWSGIRDAQLQASIRNVDAATLWPRLTGTIAAEGRADLELPETGIRGEVIIDRLGGTVYDLPVQGSTQLAFDTTAVDIASAEVVLGNNRVTGSGRIAESMKIDGSVDIRSLAELDPRASGALSGPVQVSGPIQSPAITARLTLDAPAWGDIGANSGTVELRRETSGDMDVVLVLDKLRRGTVEIAETELQLNGSLDRHSVTLKAGTDTARLESELSGSLADAAWAARLSRLDIEAEGMGLWTLDDPVALSASAESTALSRLCLTSREALGFACVDGRFDGSEGTFAVAVEQLPLAALPIALPAGASIAGYVEADTKGTIANGAVSGDGTVRLVDAVVTAVYEDEPYELAFTSASLSATVRDNSLESVLALAINDGAGEINADLDVDNLFDRNSPISGAGDISVPDVAIAAVFLPDVSNPVGTVTGSLDVEGTMAAPAFSGEIVLGEAAFDVRPAGIRITDLGLRLSQREPGQLLFDGSATSGDGKIGITGATDISLDSGLRAEFGITGRDFQMLQLPDWELSASPDIRIVLDDSMTVVSGSLDIPSADITVRSVPETAVRPSADVTVHGEGRIAPTRQRRIDVDVNASLGEDVQLSGFGLTTGISGSVRIRGGTGRPITGAGTLALDGGRYKAYGQDLEIESGDLIFNGPLDNPQLSVRAVRRIEAENVLAGIRLSGTARQLRSELFSEPPMGDADALSYLLTGRALPEPGEGGEDASLLNSAAFALGLSQAGSIASQVSGELGLDTLSVEGGAETGRIVAGKRFGPGDRLLVEYGYGLIDKLGTLLLRYQINNRLVLETRAGTVSELDIVYNIRQQ